MPDERTLSYEDALAISWSLNWRLGIANLVTLLVLGGVSSFLPDSTAKGLILVVAFFVLHVCVAWPLVLDQALSASTRTVRLNLYNRNATEGFHIPYRKSLLLALVVEGASIIFAVLTVLVLLLAGVHMERSTSGVNLLTALLQLFMVIPLGIKLFAQKLSGDYRQDSSLETSYSFKP